MAIAKLSDKEASGKQPTEGVRTMKGLCQEFSVDAFRAWALGLVFSRVFFGLRVLGPSMTISPDLTRNRGLYGKGAGMALFQGLEFPKGPST